MKTATLESKTLPVHIKTLTDSGKYSIYAASFGNIDRANEVIAPTAFKNLDDFVRDGFMAVNHSWSNLPIATVDSAVADRFGLLVSGTFHGTPEAQACRQVMKERLDRGKTVSASIGYTVLDDARMVEGGKPYRLLKSINLWELSFVNVPCNPKAVAVSVKSLRSGRANPADVAKARRDFAEYEYRRTLGLADRVAIQRAQIDYLCAIEDMPRRLLPASRA